MAKLRSPISLLSLAAALVVALTFVAAGTNAVWPIVAAAFAFVSGAVFVAVAQRNGSFRARSAEASGRPLQAIIDRGSAALQVELWVESADVTVAPPAISARRVYSIGERIRVCVRSSRSGYLTLLSLASDGRLTVLFPNLRQPERRIEGGQIRIVPEPSEAADIVLEGPAGWTDVKAIVTLDEQPLLKVDADAAEEAFRSFGAREAPRVIRLLSAEAERRRGQGLAVASAGFQVEALVAADSGLGVHR